jgi:hypothetical protein
MEATNLDAVLDILTKEVAVVWILREEDDALTRLKCERAIGIMCWR